MSDEPEPAPRKRHDEDDVVEAEEVDEPEEAPRRRRRPHRPVDPIASDPGMRLLLPVGRSVWAILSGYLGLFSLLLVPGPFAILTGVLAINDMKKNPEKHGMGRAVFGIIMGILGTMGLAFAVIALATYG